MFFLAKETVNAGQWQQWVASICALCARSVLIRFVVFLPSCCQQLHLLECVFGASDLFLVLFGFGAVAASERVQELLLMLDNADASFFCSLGHLLLLHSEIVTSHSHEHYSDNSAGHIFLLQH